jgi:hypothetical protein
MNVFFAWRKPIAMALTISMTAVSLPISSASAAMVGTDRVIAQAEGAPRARVTAFLAREDVRAQMEAMNISPHEAELRVASLSDDEVSAIAGRLDSLPAGQGGAGAIIGAVLLVFFVLLITDLLGLTSVFGFTKKGSLNPG